MGGDIWTAQDPLRLISTRALKTHPLALQSVISPDDEMARVPQDGASGVLLPLIKRERRGRKKYIYIYIKHIYIYICFMRISRCVLSCEG